MSFLHSIHHQLQLFENFVRRNPVQTGGGGGCGKSDLDLTEQQTGGYHDEKEQDGGNKNGETFSMSEAMKLLKEYEKAHGNNK